MDAALSYIADAVQPYLLNNAFLLTDLPAGEFELLEALPAEYRRRGAVLYQQGTFPRGAYWLRAGKVKIYQDTPDGQRQILYLYTAGDLMGYRQLISEEPYPISAMALTDSEVVFIPGDLFRGLLETSPHFTRNLLRALAREFSVWMNRLTLFAQLPVRRRLALSLLVLSEQFREPHGGPGVIQMTRTELAEYIGSSLETVVRALHGMKTSGWLLIQGRKIAVNNPLELLSVFNRSDG